MNENLLELMVFEQQKQELQKVLKCNEKTEKYGLVLSKEDAGILLAARENTLKEQQRIEFFEGILPKLIETFCDSPYLGQDTYVETLTELQDVFYLFKNESLDLMTDDELLSFMKEQFDGICYGSIEYLSETCMERFSRAIRAGYKGYQKSACRGEYDGYQKNASRGDYEQFSEEARWDRDVFLEVWNELIG